jgi:hypothetical protein
MYDPEYPLETDPAILTLRYVIRLISTLGLKFYGVIGIINGIRRYTGGNGDPVSATKSRDAGTHAALCMLLVKGQHHQQRSSQVR